MALHSTIEKLIPKGLREIGVEVEGAYLVNIHEDEVESEFTEAVVVEFSSASQVLVLYHRNKSTANQAIEKVSALIFNETNFRLAESIDAANLKPLEPEELTK